MGKGRGKGQSKEIALLAALFNEIPYLKQLNHNNSEYDLWRDKVLVTLDTLYGGNSREYNRFAMKIRSYNPHDSEDKLQEKYLRYVNADENALKAIIDMQEVKAKLNKVLRFERFLKSCKDLSTKIWHESKDFAATVIAKIIKEKSN